MKCCQTRWILSVWVSIHAVQIASRTVNGCTNMQPVNTVLPMREYASRKIRSVICFLHAAGHTNKEIHEELKGVYSYSLSPEPYHIGFSGSVKRYSKWLDIGVNYVKKQFISYTINVSSLDAFRCILVFLIILPYLFFRQLSYMQIVCHVDF